MRENWKITRISEWNLSRTRDDPEVIRVIRLEPPSLQNLVPSDNSSRTSSNTADGSSHVLTRALTANSNRPSSAKKRRFSSATRACPRVATSWTITSTSDSTTWA